MIVIIRYLTNDTIQTAEDVERYLDLSTLGTLPLEKNEKKEKRDVLEIIKGDRHHDKCRNKST